MFTWVQLTDDERRKKKILLLNCREGMNEWRSRSFVWLLENFDGSIIYTVEYRVNLKGYM
jgi:hypothetical protein